MDAIIAVSKDELCMGSECVDDLNLIIHIAHVNSIEMKVKYVVTQL